MDTRNTELFHYGVKGMKWGVRRAEKRALRDQHRREKYLAKTQKKYQKNRSLASDARKELKDLQTNGVKSDRVQSRAKSKASYYTSERYNSIDRATGRKTSQTVRDLSAELNYALYSDRYNKMALKELTDEANSRLVYRSKKAKQWAAANDAVMNLPANSSNRDYRRAIRNAKRYY